MQILGDQALEKRNSGVLVINYGLGAEIPIHRRLLRARRKRPRRRAAGERDELAPPTDLSKLGRSQPLCARLKGYHPEGAADRLLHCGISAPSADGFMAEMGHEQIGSS